MYLSAIRKMKTCWTGMKPVSNTRIYCDMITIHCTLTNKRAAQELHSCAKNPVEDAILPVSRTLI